MPTVWQRASKSLYDIMLLVVRTNESEHVVPSHENQTVPPTISDLAELIENKPYMLPAWMYKALIPVF